MAVNLAGLKIKRGRTTLIRLDILDIFDIQYVKREVRFLKTRKPAMAFAACTIDTFTTMFTPQFRAIGALNRFLIIGGRRGKLRPIPQRIPDAVLESLRGRTKAQIDKAVRDKPVIGFTPEAERLWQEWYHNLSESPYSARLDTYGLRREHCRSSIHGRRVHH